MAIPFVGKRMTRAEFAAHLAGLQFTSFRPKFVTLHHTASPNLSQRPNGFSAQHLQNLRHYYENTMGWSGAPHLFVDDQADGIIVFQKMERRGVHAASFNSNSWGLEMLGYYDAGADSFTSGRGAKVRDNSMHALAIMCKALGVGAQAIKFHRDDPKTSKTCPGSAVSKSDVIGRVNTILGAPAVDHAPDFTTWTLTLPDGQAYEPVFTVDGRPTVAVRKAFDRLLPNTTLQMKGNGQTVFWMNGAKEGLLPVADLDDSGRAWCFIRDITNALGKDIEINGRALKVV